jgi:DNA-binding NarL/FixJ family response regulator
MAVTALIVDDSNVAIEIIRHHLKHAGCTIVGEAVNAAQGLAQARLLKPKVVTLDLMMPKVEDIDSMAMLRALKEEMPEVAVIVASVVPFRKTQDDFLRQGVLAYVIKPFNNFSFEPVRQKLHRAFPELAEAQFGGGRGIRWPSQR